MKVSCDSLRTGALALTQLCDLLRRHESQGLGAASQTIAHEPHMGALLVELGDCRTRVRKVSATVAADVAALAMYADWVESEDNRLTLITELPSLTIGGGTVGMPAWIRGLTPGEKPPRGNAALAGIGRTYVGQRIGSGEFYGECMEAVRIWIEKATGVTTGGGGHPAGFVANCLRGGFTQVSDTTFAGSVPPPGLLPGDVITVYPGRGLSWAGPIHTFIVGDPPTTAIQQNFPLHGEVSDDKTVEYTLNGLGARHRDDVHIVVLRYPPK